MKAGEEKAEQNNNEGRVGEQINLPLYGSFHSLAVSLMTPSSPSSLLAGGIERRRSTPYLIKGVEEAASRSKNNPLFSCVACLMMAGWLPVVGGAAAGLIIHRERVSPLLECYSVGGSECRGILPLLLRATI